MLNVLHTALASSLIRGSVCVIAFASLPGNMLVVHRPVWHSTPVEKQGLLKSAVLSCFCGYENAISLEEKKKSKPRRLTLIHAFRVNILYFSWSNSLVLSALRNMNVSMNLLLR